MKVCYRDIAWSRRNEILKFEMAGAITRKFSKAVIHRLEINGSSRPEGDIPNDAIRLRIEVDPIVLHLVCDTIPAENILK